jgi:hypothetical protein
MGTLPNYLLNRKLTCKMQVYRPGLLYASLGPVMNPARLWRVVNQPAWCDEVVESPNSARPVDAKARCLGVLPIRFEGICADYQAQPATSEHLSFTSARSAQAAADALWAEPVEFDAKRPSNVALP